MDDATFLTTVTDPLPGWLLRPAAHLTLALLASQRAGHVPGGALEIGVYAGKSLTLLLHEATAAPWPILAVDTGQFLPLDQVRAHLARQLPVPETCYFHQGPSTDWHTEGVLDVLGGPVRFVSIDGSHQADDVLADLTLAAHVLGAGGLVSVDDFLNPMALGVQEAVARFFQAGQAPPLVPCCYCTNKLFLCRPPLAVAYARRCEAFIRSQSQYPESQRFVEQDALWRGAVEVPYFGHPVLIIH